MAQLNRTVEDVPILLNRLQRDPLLPVDQHVDWEPFRSILEEIWHGDRNGTIIRPAASHSMWC